MDHGLALVDDLSESLVKLAGVDVFAAVLEIAEESTSFGEGDAGAFRRSKLLLNPFSFTPESGVVLSRPVVLIEALRDLNQSATITCDRVGFHGENLAMGNSMGKTVFSGWITKSILQSKKGS
ncbi:MAG: hypothetical protein WCL08_07215 [Verrucomicrobiota bacterium]